ncbi:unnamed protein product [Durusdinium trenchii]|uniref:Methyltransferase type 11 domain-containing protein n=1 Tax=Durusdinium trenchii TaxID=1381693 RepID=A0ABP0HLI4_9DINO
MAREGDFLVRSDGPHERVFRLRNTELEIDCESISSEWTTDSEAERTIQQEQLGSRGIIEEKQTRRKRKKRAWRLRHWLRRDDDSDSKSSDSDSSSSTSSGSSSSTDGGELGSFKRQRQQVQQQWNIIKGLKSNFSPPLDGPPVLPTEDQPLRNDTEDRPLPRSVSSSGLCLCWKLRYRAFAVAPGFLQQQDIEAISSAAKHSSVREINDRKGYLAFKHRVWRFELQLRALWPDLYARLMAVMRSADEAKWKRLSQASFKAASGALGLLQQCSSTVAVMMQRSAEHCSVKGLSDLLPYAKPMMGPLVFDCHKAQDVLVLGLGGHSTREVLAVDNNENVLKVARNYFGFQGEAMIDDIHSALSKLSRLDKSFDAIVTDVGHNIRLNQEDLHNVVHLLKPNGVLMENLSTPSFAEEQVALFKDFLGDVSEEVSFLIE